MSEDKTICRYCGEQMKKWETPGESSWCGDVWYVCFNDGCSYYVKGWDHMLKTMNVHRSYRYHYSPETGECGPMPVYSSSMGRECIVEE